MRKVGRSSLILFIYAVPFLFSQQSVDHMSLYQEGLTLTEKGLYLDAIAVLTRCLEIQPQSSEKYLPNFSLGWAYYKSKDYARAKVHFIKEKEQKIIWKAPNDYQTMQTALNEIEKESPPQPDSKELERKKRAQEIKEGQRKGLNVDELASVPIETPRVLPVSGTLKVVTEPQADISINNRSYGQTDSRGEKQLSLPPGNYDVQAAKDGFEKQTNRQVTQVSAGQTTEVRVQLSRAQSPSAPPSPPAVKPALSDNSKVDRIPSGSGDQAIGDFYHPDVLAEIKKGNERVKDWIKFVAFSAIGLMIIIAYLVYRRRFAVGLAQVPGAGRTGLGLAMDEAAPARSAAGPVVPNRSDLSDSKAWGDYRLLKLIKKTSMSSIYLASHKDKKERYAIKVPHEEKLKDEAFRRRFLSEASLSSKLLHENIVEIYDIGERGTTPYFVMEYVEGRSLRDILKEKGTLSERVAVEVLTKVCQALYYAHNLNPPLIHKDIKPENILLKLQSDRVEELKLIDFGISGDFTRAVSGTPPYISREQILGESLDGRADIFSLGVLAFEMLTGRMLFEPKGFEETTQILSDPRTPFSLPTQMNTDLARILGRMLQKSKDDRYGSVEEILKDLRAYKFKYLHKEAK